MNGKAQKTKRCGWAECRIEEWGDVKDRTLAGVVAPELSETLMDTGCGEASWRAPDHKGMDAIFGGHIFFSREAFL